MGKVSEGTELLAMSGKTFDFCDAMFHLCHDICIRHQDFSHIRMAEVVITFAQTRSAVDWGMQAKLTPMRFQGGKRTELRRGRIWTVQPVYRHGNEALYLLTFYLPRFLNLCFDEKLVTIFHELYHISPRFDGDIRRFDGACYMHSRSQAAYDKQMAVYAKQYLSMESNPRLLSFLRLDFAALQQRCGNVVGLRLNTPKLIEVKEAA